MTLDAWDGAEVFSVKLEDENAADNETIDKRKDHK